MRSIVYRFPDLGGFEQMICEAKEADLELGIPSGQSVEDGEWLLAIFELGGARRATSAAARARVAPDGAKLEFEPRDWERLADFARNEARRPSTGGVAPSDSARPSSASATPVPSRPSQARRTSMEGARVLVVDDDPGIRDVVAAMLEAVGLSVAVAATAEEALEQARRERLELVVLDWNLPTMSGLELCRCLRNDRSLCRVPVLFLTANACSQDMVQAFASGADDYVVKPFRAPELGARIFSLLRRARSS